MNSKNNEKLNEDFNFNLNRVSLYLYSAKMVCQKIKDDEDFNASDFKVVRHLLEDYIKKLEDIINK